MYIEPLLFRTHPDGTTHPVAPYPDASCISVALLENVAKKWRDPDDTDVLVFAEDCRYLICEYWAEQHAFLLSRIP